jgi:hypothetical protein
MPLLPISSKETIQKCAALKTLETDVFICSYPKSGTTWTQHIVLSLLLRHKANMKEPLAPDDYNHVSDYAPFFEIDAHWEGHDLAGNVKENHARLGRRVFNTHLRFDMLPQQGSGGKFIYLIRSPLDTCVSFYHHLAHQVEGGYEGTFAEFFTGWMNGKIAFGSWVDHVLSYALAFAKKGEQEDNGSSSQVKLGDGRKVLLLSYEEMIADLPKVVLDLQEFLELQVTPEQRQEMLPSFSFSNMKQDLDRFQPQSVQWKNGFLFLRKGVAGDSSAFVSEQQRKDFQQWIDQQKFKESLSQLLKESNPEVFCRMAGLLAL